MRSERTVLFKYLTRLTLKNDRTSAVFFFFFFFFFFCEQVALMARRSHYYGCKIVIRRNRLLCYLGIWIGVILQNLNSGNFDH